MQLILAIDSDPRRSEQLASLVRARLQVDLVQATSAGEGLHALRDRVPDLILTSPLLSPFDDGVLDEYLRDLGSAATHVQTVRIPMLSSGPKKKSAAKRLFSLGRKKTADVISGARWLRSEGLCRRDRPLSDALARGACRVGVRKGGTGQGSGLEPEPVVQPRDDIWSAAEALVASSARQRRQPPSPRLRRPRPPSPWSSRPMSRPMYRGRSSISAPTPIVHSPARRVVVEPEPLAFVEPTVDFVEPDPAFARTRASRRYVATGTSGVRRA